MQSSCVEFSFRSPFSSVGREGGNLPQYLLGFREPRTQQRIRRIHSQLLLLSGSSSLCKEKTEMRAPQLRQFG